VGTTSYGLISRYLAEFTVSKSSSTSPVSIKEGFYQYISLNTSLCSYGILVTIRYGIYLIIEEEEEERVLVVLG